ncbi:MAG: hypothetical protein FIA89_02305 [Geobacter sp.]|nr:hypothetical protein [Geobacter sp.]
MALTQMQIIQSLGEAMSWFERELNWGVPATELRHLCGRIGELYAALIMNGQMATEVNQKGYDVVSGDGEKISVKTTAKMDSTGHISFNHNTLHLVDRVIILRMNTEEMQIETLLNAPIEEAKLLMVYDNDTNKSQIPFRKLERRPVVREHIRSVKELLFNGYLIRELETGSIEVEKDGVMVTPSKPKLREFANLLGISLLNTNGNKRNTRQLGSLILKSIEVQE